MALDEQDAPAVRQGLRRQVDRGADQERWPDRADLDARGRHQAVRRLHRGRRPRPHRPAGLVLRAARRRPGCGKTTTLRMVAGLEEPPPARSRSASDDITRLKPYKRPVNTVFQSYALFPHLTIFENVAFGLRRTGPQGRRSARSRRCSSWSSSQHVRQAPARPALRRPAAARGAGPGPDQPAAGAAARRAARRARPQAAPADADRAQADPDRGRASPSSTSPTTRRRP